MKKWISGFMVYVLLAWPALGAEIVNQGSGNTNTQAWKVYSAAPPSGSSSSARATSAPAVTNTTLNATASACTAVGGAGCTIVLASTQVIAWTNITITIANTGANAFTNVLVEFSPDNSTWEIWDSTTFATLATATSLSLGMAGNSRRYLRIEAKSASGSSSSVWLTMNDG